MVRSTVHLRWFFIGLLGLASFLYSQQANNPYHQHDDRVLDLRRNSNSASIPTSINPQNTRLTVGPAVRDKIWEQQNRWCIRELDIHGFQMIDAASCWGPALRKMVTVLNSTSLYREVYDVALDPLQLLKNQHIRVLGDSISRYFFTALYYVLLQEADPTQTVEPVYHWDETEFHGKMERIIPGTSNITMEWHWTPGSKEVRGFLDRLDSEDLEKADHNVIIIGNWYRSHTRERWFRDSYKKLLTDIRDLWPELNDLIIQTPPRHPDDHANDTLKQEESFNAWWANEISSGANSSTHGQATKVPVVNGFWPFQVTDQEDGIHSLTHAMYSTFLHLWRWRWLKESDETLRIYPLEQNSPMEN